ncbi:MAG: hypothetical protein R2832_10035 [Rhodothermales bacterium]
MAGDEKRDERWVRVSELVLRALAVPSNRRDRLLEEGCRGRDGRIDVALLADVKSLVRASEDAERTGALLSPVRRTD